MHRAVGFLVIPTHHILLSAFSSISVWAMFVYHSVLVVCAAFVLLSDGLSWSMAFFASRVRLARKFSGREVLPRSPLHTFVALST